MKEMILLGAGASAEAGVPTAHAMTERMLEIFEDSADLRQHTDILRFAVGGLLFQQGIKGRNPYDGVNIEDLFNAIQFLAMRHEDDVAAFVSAWHPAVDEFERVPQRIRDRHMARSIREGILQELASAFKGGLSNAQLTRGKTAGLPETIVSDTVRAMGLAFEGLVMGYTDLDPRLDEKFNWYDESLNHDGVFLDTVSSMTQKLVDTVWVEDIWKVSYLIPMINNALRVQIPIATLNYDNTLELLCSSENICVNTGIEEWSSDGRITVSCNGQIFLLKLHGSINWEASTPKNDNALPITRVAAVPIKRMRGEAFQPAVIFGQRNKLTAKGPFMELLRVFQEQLIGCERLTVIGYSFRDEHINELLSQWLNQKPWSKLRVIDCDTAWPSHEFTRMLRDKLGGRLEHVCCTASEGIARCFAA
jgi:hypothetical protein